MKERLFLYSRVLAVVFSFPFNLGFIWFLDLSLNFFLNFYIASTGLALLIVPLIPDHLFLKYSKIKIFAIGLTIIAIVNCITDMIGDVTLIHGADYDAFMLRIPIVLLLLIMIFWILSIREPAPIKNSFQL